MMDGVRNGKIDTINHKQHPGEFEGASVAYAGRFNFRFYYEKMLNSETGKCGL